MRDQSYQSSATGRRGYGVAREAEPCRRVYRAIVKGSKGIGAEIGEVTAALEVCGHVHELGAAAVRRCRGDILLSAPLLGEEKEGLFLIGIVVIGNINRAADGIAEIVFPVWGFN